MVADLPATRETNFGTATIAVAAVQNMQVKRKCHQHCELILSDLEHNSSSCTKVIEAQH